MFSLTRKNTGPSCPPGTIKRKGYTRKFKSAVVSQGFTVRRKGKLYTVKPKSGATYIPATCVKDRGMPGKGKPIFGKLRKGELIKYGYQYRLSDRLRHAALEKAIKAYGATPLYHKLDVIAKLTKHSAPDAHKIFQQDVEWIRARL